MAGAWRRRIAGVRDWLSFSGSVRELVDALNREIDAPEKLQLRLQSHPSGFARAIAWRRLTMAEAYLKLVTSKGEENFRERLDALQVLVHQAWHSKTLSMPINTARVQIALMKECVQAQGDERRQLELMSDFTRASYGQEVVIRRLLRELGLIEVPEVGKRLEDLDLGWDDHVHDMLSQGTKTPSQLLVDAFIKGMSGLTVAYYDLSDARVFEEALEAGRILGIRVEVGVEFSVGSKGQRLHFMFVPPQDGTSVSLKSFLADNQDVLQPFVEGLARNAEGRRLTICALLEQFNSARLPELNSRFVNTPFLCVEPLTWEDVRKTIHGGQASHIHLGQLLSEKLKPVFHKRVLYLKSQYRHSANRLERGEVSSWEVENVRSEYLKAREEYATCSPETMTSRYVSGNRAAADYDSAFPDLKSLSFLVERCGGRVVFIHPLSQGPRAAVRVLLVCHRLISDIEAFNMSDSLFRDPADLRRMNRLVEQLNEGNQGEVQKLLADWGLIEGSGLTVDNGQGFDAGDLAAACEHYASNPLFSRCGSDYIGSMARLPGMGFISTSRIDKRSLRMLEKREHASIPLGATRLVLQARQGGAPVDGSCRVIALSLPKIPKPNPVGDEVQVTSRGVFQVWRYLNPNLKGILKVLVAMTPAWYAVGPWYAMLWLGITGFRNILADLIATSGFMLRTWKIDNIDRDNLANSMFWTGFSVPVLSAAKYSFDTYLWPVVGVPTDSFLFVLAKFWFIAFANGLYITTHNRLRGFDRRVIRANFFRTVLSWPLATAGSFVLTALGIPDIVQSKIWSDVVAGIIEGTGKFMSRMRLRQRDFLELFRALDDLDREKRMIALADILYVWAKRDRGRSALGNLLKGRFPSTLRLPDAGELNSAWLVVHAHRRILEEISAEGSTEMLTAVILNRYSGRDAVVVTQLIGDHSEEFEEWLEDNKPSTRLLKNSSGGMASQ